MTGSTAGLAALVCLANALTGCGGGTPATAAATPSRAGVSSHEPPLGPACDGARLLATPEDLAAPGPWPVGVRTVVVDDLVVEVWYPARPGSDQGRPRARYDLREVMPPDEARKIPDADNADLACDCVRDLPIDDAHGPYPAVIFLHGAASFRAQSAFLATHWASRGFVVLAPDLPGIGLAAALGGPTSFPASAPLQLLDVTMHAPAGIDPLAFVRPDLAPHVALAGHSLGCVLASSIIDRPEVEVRIAMAGMPVFDGHASTLVLAGDHDGIAPGDSARDGFANAPAPSRLGILQGAGHLAFSDLCTVGADRGGALAIAQRHGVQIPAILSTLAVDGCRPSDTPFAETAPLVRATPAGVLEARLRGDARATRELASLATTRGLVWQEHLR